jgi:hypothetical protein
MPTVVVGELISLRARKGSTWRLVSPKRRRTFPMDMNEIHDYARRFIGTHGDRAEVEAAQKAAECKKLGERQEAEDWRRIQTAIKEMRGPHVS